jgi:hypothetical protein
VITDQQFAGWPLRSGSTAATVTLCANIAGVSATTVTLPHGLKSSSSARGLVLSSDAAAM